MHHILLKDDNKMFRISGYDNRSVISFQKVKEIAKMLFLNLGQIDNKLEAKLKKQEIVFDTAVFHFELTFDNKVISSVGVRNIKTTM